MSDPALQQVMRMVAEVRAENDRLRAAHNKLVAVTKSLATNYARTQAELDKLRADIITATRTGGPTYRMAPLPSANALEVIPRIPRATALKFPARSAKPATVDEVLEYGEE